MKILILILCSILLSGCVSFTTKERAVINGIKRGDHTLLNTMTNEELDTLKAKLEGQQRGLGAFSSNAKDYQQDLKEILLYPIKNQPKTYKTDCHTDSYGNTNCTTREH